MCDNFITLWTVAVMAIVITAAAATRESCAGFRCMNGDCVSTNKFCNGQQDCSDASDEADGCTPCNKTYFGQVGRTYEMELRRPRTAPFVCHLNFTAGGGALGELVQLTFEAFTVGTFESFTAEGCPDGHISIREGGRPALGGKWCGSAWGYSVYYSETPNVNLSLRLERLPQQQSSSVGFEFKLSYKFLRLSDARIRYGNATQRSYRGKLTWGSYCDRLLEGCSRRPCRLQSPNYPGIYPRNVSCSFRVRERNPPAGKHALIAVRQANSHHGERASKFDNSDRVLSIWDQCSVMQDYIEILDGWGAGATTLAHLCSGETVPEIISSGPELLVKFHTSPFGNPFHPLPLSYLPGFELEVEVLYVDKASPTYIEHGKKCEFVVTSFDGIAGFVESPLHSLPPNTTCYYYFRGQPNDVVWISFIKYHVSSERVPDLFDGGSECDVQLRIWDGDVRARLAVPLIGQFCRDDKPKLCDHSLLRNSSRLTRPCTLAESYVSSGAALTIAQSIRHGNVLHPVSFVLRYEFVDLSQEGAPLGLRGLCNRAFTGRSGRFYSPKNPFLYGRGGQRDLTCTYQFEYDDAPGVRLVFLQGAFGDKGCTSVFDDETGRWACRRQSTRDLAQLEVFEHPWPGVELRRDCLCGNFSEPIVITTTTARKVLVRFSIARMKITEDYHDYFFDATFEPAGGGGGCASLLTSRRLRGSSGKIAMHNNAALVLRHNERTITVTRNRTGPLCLEQPWLIEPEDAFANFIYLKVGGVVGRGTGPCPTQNRVLVYPAAKTEEVRVICPHAGGGGGDDDDDVVEMFSEGWSVHSYRKMQNRNARSFIVEFVQREVTYTFAVNWMEVSKIPVLTLPTTMLTVNPPNCPHSCPELGACISSDLWCDGLRHCPSGSDEQEANCSIHTDLLSISFLNSMALSTVVFVAITVVGIIMFYIFKHWKKEQKNVIVSVTEHTFLEFKSGLC